jgi:hypothetical protein
MTYPTLTIVTAIVFFLTYAGIALGRIPGFRLDRAGIALTGAALMLAIAPSRRRKPITQSTSTRSRFCSA